MIELIVKGLPGPTFFSGIAPAHTASAGRLRSGEKLSFVCPQVVAGFRFSEDTVPVGTPIEPFAEDDKDFPVSWVDFVFTVKYSPIPFVKIPFWSQRRRMTAQPDNHGILVWSAAALDQIIDRPSYRSPAHTK
jgi:hypothetical protein